MFDDDVKLLAIVSLTKEGRVKCQHPGCNRTVYKRVHVIKAGNVTTFVGSTCFRKLYGDHDHQPLYGSSEGRTLTPEERDAIIANTEMFLQRLQSKEADYDGVMDVQHSPPPVESTLKHAATRTAEIHVYTCLRCSGDNRLFKFESRDRTCPRCNLSNEVFTIK